MTAPFHFNNKVTILFEAKSYDEFEQKYKKMNKVAGGGITSSYTRKGASKFEIEFYYPSSKSVESAKIRFKEIEFEITIKD